MDQLKEASLHPNEVSLEGSFTLMNRQSKMKIKGSFEQIWDGKQLTKTFAVKEPKEYRGQLHTIQYHVTDGSVTSQSTHQFSSEYSNCLFDSNVHYLDLLGLDMMDFKIQSSQYVMRGIKNYWEVNIVPKDAKRKEKYQFRKALMYVNSTRLLPERIGYVPLGQSYYKLIVLKGYKSIGDRWVPTVIDVSYVESDKTKRGEFTLSFKGLKVLGSKWYHFFN